MRGMLRVSLLLCGIFLLAAGITQAKAGHLPTGRVSVAQREEPQEDIPSSMPLIDQGVALQEYVLGAGDRVRLTVFGEKDISGTYDVSSTGVIALPLIGDVPAAGQSISVFEKAVRSKLAQGYLRDPRVSAQVVNYRPFFILGEVAKPGSYPYMNGMTILNAVALAGGYTYRADKNDMTITRANDSKRAPVDVSETEIVMPGDIIRVPERFF